MRKSLAPVTLLFLCLACFALTVSGCASPPEAVETTSITRLWEPALQPNFDFRPAELVDESAGHTVGIVRLDFNYEAVPTGEWILTAEEQQHRDEFIDSFFEGLRKILVAKGIDVRGPYPTYDDMTFDDRSQCDFVLQPEVLLERSTKQMTLIEELSGYGGPYGEPRIYGRSENRLDATTRLELDIIDPRTRKQLEWYMLKTDTISKSYDQLWSRWTMTFGHNSRTGWRVLEYNQKKYPNYHNGDNATGRVFEDVYHDFMPRLNTVLTVDEFKRLDSRKMETKKRE